MQKLLAAVIIATGVLGPATVVDVAFAPDAQAQSKKSENKVKIENATAREAGKAAAKDIEWAKQQRRGMKDQHPNPSAGK